MESLYVPVIMKVAQVKNQKKQVYRCILRHIYVHYDNLKNIILAKK